MKENYPQALKQVLKYEGGKVDDPRDPGGRTAFGITQDT
jgi:lysozyme family protein